MNAPDTPAALVAGMREALTAVADPGRAPAMEAYLKDRFPFLGVPSPVRRAAVKPLALAARSLGQAEVLEVADRLWREPEREFQQVGVDVVRAAAPRWDGDALPAVRALVQSKSWWDTVDGLAHSVGDLVLAHPRLVAEMDRWIDDDCAPDWPYPPERSMGCHPVIVHGDPDVTLTVEAGDADGDRNVGGVALSAGRLVHALPAVRAARTGLITAMDLPLIPGRGVLRV